MSSAIPALDFSPERTGVWATPSTPSTLAVLRRRPRPVPDLEPRLDALAEGIGGADVEAQEHEVAQEREDAEQARKQRRAPGQSCETVDAIARSQLSEITRRTAQLQPSKPGLEAGPRSWASKA